MSTRQTNARLTRAKRKILPPGEKKKKTCAKEHLLCYMIQKIDRIFIDFTKSFQGV
jgi:hypothetical protein